jgi:hypothetical protein
MTALLSWLDSACPRLKIPAPRFVLPRRRDGNSSERCLGDPLRKQHYGEETGKGPGDTIEAVVWKDEAERTVEVPAQFENLMKKEGLLPVFKKLSYTHRKQYCRWIAEAKKEETRLKRLEIRESH